jgi:hypothetical protein
MGRGRNIILAYIYRTVAMKNRRKWAVENDRLASNGLSVRQKQRDVVIAFWAC